jgi:putative ABC transport system permease protein
MIRNYLTIAYRNLLKHRFYSLINIWGLAIGLSSCLLISLYVVEELSYDDFHEDAERIYRVRNKFTAGEKDFDMEDVAPALVNGIREMIPQAEKTIRLEHPNPYIFKKENEILNEVTTIRSDSNFFSFFGFELLAGDPASVLATLRSLVLSKEVADVYCGKPDAGNDDAHPALGKRLAYEGEDYTITGIAEEVPSNSHLQFDAVMSNLESQIIQDRKNFWLPAGFMTYMVLQENTEPESLKADFLSMEQRYVWPLMEERLGTPRAILEERQQELGHYLVPVTDIHLITDGYLKYVYILSAIGIFLVLIACINYMNLATARSAKRAREVGIRKALGTTKTSLIGQFMSESFLITLLAMILALGLTELMRIPFNRLSGKALSMNLLQEPLWFPAILGLTLIISVLAGIYPSFYLSLFKPAEVLKGKIVRSSRSKLRNGLVIFQFGISATLIICALLVYQQLLYMQGKDVGFEKENVVLIPNAFSLENPETFRQSLLQHSQVEAVSFSTTSPGDVFDAMTTLRKEGSEEKYQAKVLGADYAFEEVFDLQLLQGRWIKEKPGAEKEAVLNESAARQFKEGILGSTVETFHGEKMKIVGIVKDFNFEHLSHDIVPLIITDNTEGWSYYASVRIRPGDMQHTLEVIESSWKEHNREALFTYTFLDRKFNDLFKTEQRLSVFVAVFTGIIIFIASIGLLGLIAYMAEQRTKEIGVRKVMGASVSDIMLMLSGSFTRLIMLAFVLAVPLAYLLIEQWLSDFAYRIDVAAWPFALAGGILFILAWLTVSWQSVRAARANPVDSLRSE